MAKPVFCRPVEITADTDTVYVCSSADYIWVDVTIPQGTYPTVGNVLEAFRLQAESLLLPANGWSIVKNSDSTDLVTELNFSVASAFVGNSILGFYGNEATTFATKHTSAMRPENMWVPTYQNANQNRFALRQTDQFFGQMTRTGKLVGNGLGTEQIFYKDFEFVNELAENVLLNACTSDCARNRCAEWFFWQCRTFQCETYSHPCGKGFYFYENWDNISELPDVNDTGGIAFEDTTDHDHYVFAQIDENGFQLIGPSLPTTMTRYSIAMKVHTVSDVPTFDEWLPR